MTNVRAVQVCRSVHKREAGVMHVRSLLCDAEVAYQHGICITVIHIQVGRVGRYKCSDMSANRCTETATMLERLGNEGTCRVSDGKVMW